MNDSRVPNTTSEKSQNFDSEYYNSLLKQIDESQERVKQTEIILDKIKAQKEIQILQGQLEEVRKSQPVASAKEVFLLVKIGDEFLMLEDYQQALTYYRKAVSILQNSDDTLYTNDTRITLVDLLMRIYTVFSLLGEREHLDLTYSKLLDIANGKHQIELIKSLRDSSISQDNLRVLVQNNFKSLEQVSHVTNVDVSENKSQTSNRNRVKNFVFFIIILLLVIAMLLLVIQLSSSGR